MASQLPEWMRGVCLLGLAPGALVPLTAVVLAIASGLVLRSFYDLLHPLPPRSLHESGRLMLQWAIVFGLAVLLFYALNNLAGQILPAPDKLGPLFRVSVGVCGALLALRAVLRMQFAIFAPPPAPTIGLVPELMVPTEIEADAARLSLSMPHGDVAPTPSFWRHSNLPSFLAGVVLLGAALTGWNTASLCLLKLPGGS